MQALIKNQRLSSTKFGVRKQMPQASRPPLNVDMSAVASYTPLTPPSTPSSNTMPWNKRRAIGIALQEKVAQNPIELPPEETQDELTSLNWLLNLKVKMTSSTPPASPQPCPTVPSPSSSSAVTVDPTQYTPSMQVNPNAVLNMDYGNANASCTFSTMSSAVHVKQEPGLISTNPALNTTLSSTFLPDMIPSPCTSSPGLDQIDYKTNPSVKPPHSYATLISMAMKATKKNKITLSGIYNWITDNFMYYKVADPSWQNSIRHNLSLNKCFQKVARRKDEPGKGGFWRINPEYEDNFVNGVFKKRRGSTGTRDMPLCMASTSTVTATSSSSLKRVRSLDDGIDSDSSNSNGPISSARPTKMPKLSPIKKEACGESVLDKDMELTWNSILSQDITVGDVKVKTEDIIDGESDIASPITDMSPPPSEGSNSEEFLEDFLSSDFLKEPLDFTTGGPLDLSITGTGIEAPTWWDTSLNLTVNPLTQDREQDSGLHTPTAQSPVSSAEYPHPWADNRTELDTALGCLGSDMASFDLDELSSHNS